MLRTLKVFRAATSPVAALSLIIRVSMRPRSVQAWERFNARLSAAADCWKASVLAKRDSEQIQTVIPGVINGRSSGPCGDGKNLSHGWAAWSTLAAEAGSLLACGLG